MISVQDITKLSKDTPDRAMKNEKKDNKQCLLDTPAQ